MEKNLCIAIIRFWRKVSRKEVRGIDNSTYEVPTYLAIRLKINSQKNQKYKV